MWPELLPAPTFRFLWGALRNCGGVALNLPHQPAHYPVWNHEGNRRVGCTSVCPLDTMPSPLDTMPSPLDTMPSLQDTVSYP